MLTITKYERALILIFLVTLPFVNPWVRGDGVGYYAFARAILVEHSLDFRRDWLNANSSFRMSRLDSEGNILPNQFTPTGHLDNHFAVGSAILWAPFLIVAHAGVLLADALGAHIPADGFSRPYTLMMAMGTVVYGFLSLLIAFRIARRYAPEEYAFTATLAIWFGSSLPVYMYFNPSWSHAHSAFMVAVFIWYWLETNAARNIAQWAVLGAIGGLMMDVYYVNAMVLLLPAADSLRVYYQAAESRSPQKFVAGLVGNLCFATALLLAFAPTLISKKIIYGGFFKFGYRELWLWHSPAFFKVAFSSDHGLFAWTPILLVAVIGLFLLIKSDTRLALGLIGVFFAYLYFIGCYQDWDGLSSFGNRFFVSLTPLFVIGLTAVFHWIGETVPSTVSATAVATGATAIFVALNFGLIFQWGTHLIPARGPISLRRAAYNEVAVVPMMAAGTVKSYLTGRSSLMNHIEEEDVRTLKSASGETP